MAKKAIILAVVAMAALAVQVVGAADHPVGGDGAWDASGTNYNAWSAKQKFVQGDTMSFKYSASSHDVTEVTKAGYDACSGANPVKSYSGGATTIKLTSPGKRYFICSVPGHCNAGMKLEVTVAAGARQEQAPPPQQERRAGLSACSGAGALLHRRRRAAQRVHAHGGADAQAVGAASIRVLGTKTGMALAVGMAIFALAI